MHQFPLRTIATVRRMSAYRHPSFRQAISCTDSGLSFQQMRERVSTVAFPSLVQFDVLKPFQRFFFVVYQLAFQIFEVMEHAVLAYPVVKVNGNVVSVNIAIEVE